MTALGIDYSATRAYFGIVEKSKVLHIASLNLVDPKAFLLQYQSLLTSFWSHYGVTGNKIVIEQSWSQEGHYAWTGLKTEHMKTLLQAGALLSKASIFEPIFVLPLVWRKAVFGNGRPENPKDKAVEWVKEHLDFEVPVIGKTGRGHKPDHNFAEAICLAVYGNMQS